MMWSSFPWPVLFVIPVMIAMVVFMALRSGFGRGSMGPGRWFGAPSARPEELAKPPAAEDPLVTLRERYARGEIGKAEFEDRLDGLLRSDPGEAKPRPDT